METQIKIHTWNDVRNHLRRNGIKVAKQACCPGCGDNEKSKIDFDNDTYVFVRTSGIRAFNNRGGWNWRQESDNSIWFTWGGDGQKICDVLSQIGFTNDWDGDPGHTIHATLVKA